MTATCCAYWLSPLVMRRYLLIISTVAILAYADVNSLLTLAAMTAVVCIAMQARGSRQTSALLGACAAVLGVLVAFKLFEAVEESPSMIKRLVPLGLSYYSLRCVHLLLESYLGQIRRPSPAQVVDYLFFPATIIAGPIHRYPAFASEKPPAFEPARLSEGLERILYGYFKIIVISNYLLTARLFPWAMSGLESTTAGYQYLDSLSYGLTIYLQFSGYSDIVIGFALILGHRVIENFSWPLFKPNIVAFWRSWHISLTSLCREYVFTSVYASTRRAWLGVLATMLMISLWHGLTFNYLAWGLYHGAGVVLYQKWSSSRARSYLHRILPGPVSLFLGWFITFQFVIFGFVWTKEADLATSIDAFVILISWAAGYV